VLGLRIRAAELEQQANLQAAKQNQADPSPERSDSTVQMMQAEAQHLQNCHDKVSARSKWFEGRIIIVHCDQPLQAA